MLVDAVVTDKKGNYVHDLTQKDFKVYEDNKEQQVASFSTGADVAVQANNAQKRYLILFFDNSSMAAPDQIQARGAAVKIHGSQRRAGPLMAVVDFGGTLRIAQNFTANPDALRAAISGVKTSYVASNATSDVTGSGSIAPPGFSSISSAETDFGARTMLLAVRSLAKNLRSVPGRKMLVLFSAGFALTPENQSELTATIDALQQGECGDLFAGCARPGCAGAPGGGSARNDDLERATSRRSYRRTHLQAHSAPDLVCSAASRPIPNTRWRWRCRGRRRSSRRGREVRWGTGGGTGRRRRERRRAGTGALGGKGGTGTGTGTGTGGKGGGTTGNPGGTRGGGTTPPITIPTTTTSTIPTTNRARIIPQLPPSVTTNQQILAALADGTGGFSIFNTNDLLGGLRTHWQRAK